VYSDHIEGPWKDHQDNPVLKSAAAPDIRWIEEEGKFYLWAHRKNSQTECWTSEDGLRFEYQGISVSADNIGTRNASYSRVYEYPIERYGSKYIMLYSGFIVEKGIRCVWLAHSTDGENWTQLKTPLVEPVEGENHDAYGPALLQWEGRNFIVYQDHTAWRGGNIKCVEVDRELKPVGNRGERFVLMDPPATLNERYRGGEFYRENNTLYLISGASKSPRVLGYATAEIEEDAAEEERDESRIKESRLPRTHFPQKKIVPVGRDTPVVAPLVTRSPYTEAICLSVRTVAQPCFTGLYGADHPPSSCHRQRNFAALPFCNVRDGKP